MADDVSTKLIESMSNEELRQEIKKLDGNKTAFQRRWTMIQELGSRARLGQAMGAKGHE